MSTTHASSSDEEGNFPAIMNDDIESWERRAESILKDLPSPSIPTLPKNLASDLSKYKSQPDCTPAEALQKCADAIERYDADSCKAYREEINTLLVFAGLFSAVLTAFIIESYQWLQEDPNDAVIALLSQLAQAQSSKGAPSPAGLPDAVSARINAYWFVSLILSLSAAFVAILCKQWVREFERHAVQSHTQFISVRQMKFEGFEAWGVAAIVASIPLILQGALALFVLGLAELLWNLHVTVAIVVLIPCVGIVLFYAATTLLPALQLVSLPLVATRTIPQCPFKSPQSMLALRASLVLLKHLHFCDSTVTPVVASALAYLQRRISASFGRVRFWVNPGNPDSASQNARLSSASLLLHALFTLHGEVERDSESLSSGDTSVQYVRRWWAWWRELPRVHKVPILPPIADHLQSWITLDGELCSIRDSLYTDGEYNDAVKWHHTAVPAVSFFRGLSWLRTHIDQPALPRWIWLSVWAILADDSGNQIRNISQTAVYHGILHLIPAWQHRTSTPYTPVFLTLIYATYLDFEATFVVELFIHNLTYVDPHAEGCLPVHLANRLSSLIKDLDTENIHALLHAILAFVQARKLSDKKRARALRQLLVSTTRAVSSVITQPELACVVATYFRFSDCYPRLHLRDLSDADHVFSLLKVLEECLERSGGCHRLDLDMVKSPHLEASFCSLAAALDHYYMHLKDGARSDFYLAYEIATHTSRHIYIRLLSICISSLHHGPETDGDRLAAVHRFRDYILPRAHNYGRTDEGAARSLQTLYERDPYMFGSVDALFDMERDIKYLNEMLAALVHQGLEVPDYSMGSFSEPGPADYPESDDDEIPGPSRQQLADSGAVAASPRDAELGPAGAAEHDYDEISLLARPAGPESPAAVSDSHREAELEMIVSSAPGDDAPTGSPCGSDHESLSAAEDAARDEERERAFFSALGDIPGAASQSVSDRESVSAAVLASSEAEPGTETLAASGDSAQSSQFARDTEHLAASTGRDTQLDAALAVTPGDEARRPDSTVGHGTLTAGAPGGRGMGACPADGDEATRSPESGTGHELRGPGSSADTGSVTPISSANNADVPCQPETQAGQGLRSPSREGAPGDVNSPTTISPADDNDAANAPTEQGPDDCAAATVAPSNVAPGLLSPTAHDDDEISLHACRADQALGDPCTAAASAPESETEIPAAGGESSTGPHSGTSSPVPGSPSAAEVSPET